AVLKQDSGFVVMAADPAPDGRRLLARYPKRLPSGEYESDSVEIAVLDPKTDTTRWLGRGQLGWDDGLDLPRQECAPRWGSAREAAHIKQSRDYWIVSANNFVVEETEELFVLERKR